MVTLLVLVLQYCALECYWIYINKARIVLPLLSTHIIDNSFDLLRQRLPFDHWPAPVPKAGGMVPGQQVSQCDGPVGPAVLVR